MTSPGTTFTQWSTIAPWLGTLPAWVSAEDQERIAAYAKYEEIYWSSEEGFAEVLRGDNEQPVFMPTAKTLVDTVNRYTAPGFNYVISSPVTADGTAATNDEAVAVAQLAFEQLFKREMFFSKFNAAKRNGLIRGDWIFHILADDTKPVGKRLKIYTVDPGAYFPVYDENDPDKLVKVHLAEQIVQGSDTLVSRLTYTRVFDANGNQTGITVEHALFKPDEWTAADAKPTAVVMPVKTLPPAIPAIPVYHLRNFDPTMPFGSSEMRGLESVLLGINQTVSDEDMALALDGIGIYATDAGTPVDENGNEVDYIMGPGRVLSGATNLRRISGVGSVTPYGDHYDRMFGAARQSLGASDVAIGKVESATAESGVALLLQLAPMLASTGEKDQHIIDVMSQFFYDLCYWLATYEELTPLLMSGGEGATVPSVLITPTIGEKIPTNLKQLIENIAGLRSLVPPLISVATSTKLLRAAGLALEENEAELVAQEEQATADAAASADAGATDEALFDTEVADV